MKRQGIMTLLFIFLTLPLSASMVSFLVVEEGPGINTGDYSGIWEDGFMSAFFDAGHIVSNSPILRIEKLTNADLPDEVNADYLEARDGGAEFFILAVLEFTPENRSRPSSINIKVFETNTQRLTYEQKFAAGTGVSNEPARAKETAKIVAAQIR